MECPLLIVHSPMKRFSISTRAFVVYNRFVSKIKIEVSLSRYWGIASKAVCWLDCKQNNAASLIISDDFQYGFLKIKVPMYVNLFDPSLLITSASTFSKLLLVSADINGDLSREFRLKKALIDPPVEPVARTCTQNSDNDL